MSRTVEIVDGRVEGRPADGRALAFDRDWIPAGDRAPVPAIEVDADPAAYGAPLGALAAAAVAAADGDAVLVIGSGAVAGEARRLLSAQARAVGDDEPPTSVIEATGDPESVRGAMQAVASMGTVVLAGETGARVYDLDLYTDAHVRGLRLKGVPMPHAAGAATVAGGQPLRAGERLDPAALYYVLLAG